MHSAQLVLQPTGGGTIVVGAGGRIGRERVLVGAPQGVQVGDRLLQRGGVGIAERDRRLEVRDRLERGAQRARVLGGGDVRERGRRVISGELEVASDDRRVVTAALQRLRDPAMQQSPPGETDSLFGDRAQAFVAEVVGGVAFEDHAPGTQLFERARDLLLRAAAREAQRVSVEHPPDQHRGAEHLCAGFADRVQAGLECGAHTATGARGLEPGGQQLGDEQRQTLALAEHALGSRLVETRLQREADHVRPCEPPQRQALPQLGEARVDPLWIRFVGAASAEQQQPAPFEPAGQVPERIQRRRVTPL